MFESEIGDQSDYGRRPSKMWNTSRSAPGALQQRQVGAPLKSVIEENVGTAWATCTISEDSGDRADLSLSRRRALGAFPVADPIADPVLSRWTRHQLALQLCQQFRCFCCGVSWLAVSWRTTVLQSREGGRRTHRRTQALCIWRPPWRALLSNRRQRL